MTTKARVILCDTLYILFFGLYAGWAFSLINFIILLFVQPLLMLPPVFIRPCVVYNNKMKKVMGIIMGLVIFIMTIAVFMAYFKGVKSADSSLWPFELKLTMGLGFLTIMIVVLYKLLQDLKIPEEDGR